MLYRGPPVLIKMINYGNYHCYNNHFTNFNQLGRLGHEFNADLGQFIGPFKTKNLVNLDLVFM